MHWLSQACQLTLGHVSSIVNFMWLRCLGYVCFRRCDTGYHSSEMNEMEAIDMSCQQVSAYECSTVRYCAWLICLTPALLISYKRTNWEWLSMSDNWFQGRRCIISRVAMNWRMMWIVCSRRWAEADVLKQIQVRCDNCLIWRTYRMPVLLCYGPCESLSQWSVNDVCWSDAY